MYLNRGCLEEMLLGCLCLAASQFFLKMRDLVQKFVRGGFWLGGTLVADRGGGTFATIFYGHNLLSR